MFLIRWLKRIIILLTGIFTGPTLRLQNDPLVKIAELKKTTGKNILFLLWHENFAAPLYFYRGQGLGLLREASNKGDDLAFCVRFFGYRDFGVTDNSADKVSIKGTIQFIKYLQQGHDGNIALDGPNGPYHQPKPGVFQIAEKANMLILPVGVWYSRKIVLKKRWDKYQWPLPFSSWRLEVGEPFMVGSDYKTRIDYYLQQLACRMQEINKIAEEKGKACKK